MVIRGGLGWGDPQLAIYRGRHGDEVGHVAGFPTAEVPLELVGGTSEEVLVI